MALLHLRDCQNLRSSDTEFDYQRLDKLDSHWDIFCGINNTKDLKTLLFGLWGFKVKHHQTSPIGTRFVFYHPNVQSNIFDQKSKIIDFLDLIGDEERFLENETQLVPKHFSPVLGSPFPSGSPHLQQVSSPRMESTSR